MVAKALILPFFTENHRTLLPLVSLYLLSTSKIIIMLLLKTFLNTVASTIAFLDIK